MPIKGKAGLLAVNEGNATKECLQSISLCSGLSIQNPDRRGAMPGGRMVRDLLRRAAEEYGLPSYLEAH